MDGRIARAEDIALVERRRWQERGYVVEGFIEITGMPEWRDQILRSSGYSSARLLCVDGSILLRRLGNRRADGSTEHWPAAAGWQQLRAGESSELHIGTWHAISATGGEGSFASWLYVMTRSTRSTG